MDPATEIVLNSKSKRAKFETVILFVIILITILISVGITRFRINTAKSELMMAELEQIRSAVATYVLLNNMAPDDLKALTNMVYSFPALEEPRYYFSNIHINEKGELVDPFGNPYRYDSKFGWVMSSTRGYQNW